MVAQIRPNTKKGPTNNIGLPADGSTSPYLAGAATLSGSVCVSETLDIGMSRALRQIRRQSTPVSVANTSFYLTQLSLLGEVPFSDAASIGKMLSSLGLTLGAHIPSLNLRDVRRAVCASAVAVVRPRFPCTAGELRAAGLGILPSAPIGVEGTHFWLEQIGNQFGLPRTQIATAQNAYVARIWERLSRSKVEARVAVSGDTGTELHIARMLVECGAEVPRVCTSGFDDTWASVDAQWLETNGTQVRFDVAPEVLCADLDAFLPDLVIGPPAVTRRAEKLGLATLDVRAVATNCPMMGPNGVGPLARLANKAIQSDAPLPTFTRNDRRMRPEAG